MTTRHWIGIAKFVLAILVLGYLIRQAITHDEFTELWRQPKDWRLLFLAVLGVFLAVMSTFVRWYFLVRTLNIPLRFMHAVRLGAVGYLFNFVALGSVGGDLVKAILLAKSAPGRRTEAVATVVLDRIIGLYSLLLVASGAIWITRMHEHAENDLLRWLCDLAFFLTACGAAGICLLLVPGFTGGRASRIAQRIPGVGDHLLRCLNAVRIYRGNLHIVVLAAVMSVIVHCFFTVSIYLIASGFPGESPSLPEHFVIVPLSMVAGAVPITPNGLGTFEATVEFLYQIVPVEIQVTVGKGTVVALGYRLITLCVAGIGAIYYFASRQRIDLLLDSAKDSSLEP